MELTGAEIWKIQDDIKFKRIHFHEGDRVMLFCKRKDGYPKYLKVGDYGIIQSVELNHIIVDFRETYSEWIIPIDISSRNLKLPKKYFVEKIYLRELKLRQLGIN